MILFSNYGGSAMNSSSPALIVGADTAGAACARETAEARYSVPVIDRRVHIAGDAFDAYDPHGVLIHHYGPRTYTGTHR